MKDINILKDIELFLLDMDGTIYLDDDVFDGAYEFLDKIRTQNKKYIFLTNNSSKDKIEYLEKLNRLHIKADEENIFTSGMAMGMYLQAKYPDKSVYLVGTKALRRELEAYNVKFSEDNPDIVLVGFDKELTYEKLEKACEEIDRGAIFLATNTDFVCPIKDKRYIPDCGSICYLISQATKKMPKYIGKPEPDMINILANKYHLQKEKIAIVGDRVYTDIASGYNAHVNTICVLSGESNLDTIKESKIKPDFVFNSIKDLVDLI